MARLPFDSYCKAIGTLVDSLVSNPKAAMFIEDLGCGDDSLSGDLMRHSSTVTYLALLIGLRLEGYLVRQRRHVDPARAKEVTNLGIGAMLHDIGITRLDEQVRLRFAESGDENDPAWREHPSLGYEMVHGQIEPTAATCVLHHHQRFDGSGYIGAERSILEGERIHVFARIVGMADYFDRIRHPAGAAQQPAVFALGAMLHPSVIVRFDPEVIRALFSVVPPYPPGSIVKLSNHRHAVVIDHNMLDPCRPTVQSIPSPDALDADDVPPGQTINLAEVARDLFVIECNGEDVAELNFGPPMRMLDYVQQKRSA